MDENINNPINPPVNQGVSSPVGSAGQVSPSTAPPSAPPPLSTPTTPPAAATQSPQPAQTGPLPPPPQEPQVMTGESKKSKFPLIIGVIVIVNLIIWGFVIYSYLQNRTLKSDLSQAETTPTLTPTPTDIVVEYTYQIDNGNVVKASSLGDSTIVINKESYEETGITGFTFVALSPSESRLCFWSMSPSLEPALYHSDIEGINVTKVSEKVTDCTWSNNSTMIAYVNDTAQTSASDIYLYDLNLETESQLTSSTGSATYRRYSIDSWSLDNTKILCSFEEMSTATSGAQITGDCEIDIENNSVLDL